MDVERVPVSYRLKKSTKKLLERLARKLDRSQTWVMDRAIRDLDRAVREENVQHEDQ